MTIRTDIYTVDWETSPRIITIADSVVIGDAQDLYDTLMHYEALPENMDNPNIVIASGKEELASLGSSTTSVGLTVVLLNARYKFANRSTQTECVMTGGNVLANDVSGNKMYPVEPSTNVFADRDLSANATINTIEVSGIAQEMVYDGMVYINADTGVAGTAYPIGTLAQPSNNLADAITIASGYNIHKLILQDDLTLTMPLNGFHIKGDGSPTVNLNNQLTNGTTFETCEVTGTQNGSFTIFINARIGELDNFAGMMTGCFFLNNTPIKIQSHISSVISDCRSGVAGSGSPCFDYSNGFITMNMRAYSGGIKVINSTNAENTSTYEFIAGKFNFDTTNTLGSFRIRGVVDTTNISSGGATVTTDGVAPSVTGALSPAQNAKLMGLENPALVDGGVILY